MRYNIALQRDPPVYHVFRRGPKLSNLPCLAPEDVQLPTTQGNGAEGKGAQW